jgi:hypothetical protein
MFRTRMRAASAAALIALASLAAPSLAQTASRNYAPGFSQRAPGSRMVVVQTDMELYSQSAGGVLEPRADWTEAAQKHFRAALMGQKKVVGDNTIELQEKDMDELAQLNALHGAVADAVFMHHMLRAPQLPTKEGVLDWTLGESVQPLRERTGADYALFFWIRDSYASAERKVAMVAMAILGVGITGGAQVGYASLVDLRTGRIVWFNNLARGFGDLREADPAKETVESLLKGFPEVASK